MVSFCCIFLPWNLYKVLKGLVKIILWILQGSYKLGPSFGIPVGNCSYPLFPVSWYRPSHPWDPCYKPKSRAKKLGEMPTQNVQTLLLTRHLSCLSLASLTSSSPKIYIWYCKWDKESNKVGETDTWYKVSFFHVFESNLPLLKKEP